MSQHLPVAVVRSARVDKRNEIRARNGLGSTVPTVSKASEISPWNSTGTSRWWFPRAARVTGVQRTGTPRTATTRRARVQLKNYIAEQGERDMPLITQLFSPRYFSNNHLQARGRGERGGEKRKLDTARGTEFLKYRPHSIPLSRHRCIYIYIYILVRVSCS